MIELELQWACEPQEIPTEALCKQWVLATIQPEFKNLPLAVTIRVVGLEEGRQLNHDYRGKDYATNVLSFSYDTPPGLVDNPDEPFYLGDLVICAPVVIQEAENQQKTLEEHWAHLVVHGSLHLQDFDHIEEEQAVQMEALESQIMQSLGYPDPY